MLVVISKQATSGSTKETTTPVFLGRKGCRWTTQFSPQGFGCLLGGQAPALHPGQPSPTLRGEARRAVPQTPGEHGQRPAPAGSAIGSVPALGPLWREEEAPPQDGGQRGRRPPPARRAPGLASGEPRPAAVAGERQGVAPRGAVIGPRRRQSPVAAATRTPSCRHTPALPLSAADWPERR